MGRVHRFLLELAADRSVSAPPPDDAGELVRSAYEHRMQGLLWSAYAAGSIELPQELGRRLAVDDMRVQAHHSRLWTALGDVQTRLSSIGIQTAALKGVTSESRWYRRIGERPCQDIDLLLEPGAQKRLSEILDVLELRHPFRSEIVRLFSSGVLQSVDLWVAGIALDLHADPLKVEIPTRGAGLLWSRTGMIRGQTGIPVRAIDPESSLILFAIHLNKDRFAQLLGYSDLARILIREPLDWAFIDSFLGREGLRVPVYSTLNVVASALDLPRLPLPRPRGWRATAWCRLWPAERRLAGYVGLGTGQHRQLWIPWLAEGRSREAAKWWLRRRLLPPASLLRVYDPDLRGPYPVRWVVGRYRARQKRRRQERAARVAAPDSIALRRPARR